MECANNVCTTHTITAVIFIFSIFTQQPRVQYEKVLNNEIYFADVQRVSLHSIAEQK